MQEARNGAELPSRHFPNKASPSTALAPDYISKTLLKRTNDVMRVCGK